MATILVPFDGMYYPAKVDVDVLKGVSGELYNDTDRFVSHLAHGEALNPVGFIPYGVTLPLVSMVGNFVENLDDFFSQAKSLARESGAPYVLVGDLSQERANGCQVNGLVNMLLVDKARNENYIRAQEMEIDSLENLKIYLALMRGVEPDQKWLIGDNDLTYDQLIEEVDEGSEVAFALLGSFSKD
jgi:hypothetical protein